LAVRLGFWVVGVSLARVTGASSIQCMRADAPRYDVGEG
jgi:hypothetical protein